MGQTRRWLTKWMEGPNSTRNENFAGVTKLYKTRVSFRCSERVSYSWYTSVTRRVIQYSMSCLFTIDISLNWYRDWFVVTTVGTYPLLLVKWIIGTGHLNNDGERNIYGVMTIISPREILGSETFLSPATLLIESENIGLSYATGLLLHMNRNFTVGKIESISSV